MTLVDRLTLNLDIDVLHVDATCIVLNKPSGLLSVPGRGPDKQDCLSARVQLHYPDTLVVHRLDMSTSGLIVMARSAAAQRALSDAFARRLVSKRYVAVVHGRMACDNEDWQDIDLPIRVDWPNRPLRVVDMATGQACLTRVRPDQYDSTKNTTRVLLEPFTGRSHQLRVHMQALGHPILGDALYAPPAVQAMATRLLLHASDLSFPHPTRSEMVDFQCPADF